MLYSIFLSREHFLFPDQENLSLRDENIFYSREFDRSSGIGEIEDVSSLGKIRIFDTYLSFPTVSGVRFRELSALVHEDFDAIAADAKANRNPKVTLEKLSATMKHCVSCHETFYLTDKIPAK